MKKLLFIAVAVVVFSLGFIKGYTTPAEADWRWASPHLKKQTVAYHCSTFKCIRHTYIFQRHRLKHRIARYNAHRLAEWKKWISTPIADCTWYGESGSGPQFARHRYTTPNSAGSGAYGKYQMMPGTYSFYAKYGDWSPLDQEIAGHRLYAAQGTSPWQACG